jgi:hypothetical protein
MDIGKRYSFDTSVDTLYLRKYVNVKLMALGLFDVMVPLLVRYGVNVGDMVNNHAYVYRTSGFTDPTLAGSVIALFQDEQRSSFFGIPYSYIYTPSVLETDFNIVSWRLSNAFSLEYIETVIRTHFDIKYNLTTEADGAYKLDLYAGMDEISEVSTVLKDFKITTI